MGNKVVDLLKSYCFLLKLVELTIACASISILSRLKEYSVPRWLWLTYCFDSITYAAILFTIVASYIVDAKHESMEFTFCVLGVILYWIGGISGIVRGTTYDPADDENSTKELNLGLLFLGSSLPMLIEVVLKTIAQKLPRTTEISNS